MHFSKYLSILIALFLFWNCEKDVEIKESEHPILVTNPPIVTKEGAQFSAEIKDLGKHKIIAYGFVWGMTPNATILDYKKLMAKQPVKGIYTYDNHGGLIKGQRYYVRAYMLTEQSEEYGNEISFESQGSLPPVIHGFSPTEGIKGTKVTIDGDNFVLTKAGNIVKFGSIQVPVDSVTENRLIVTLPPFMVCEKVPITVETEGVRVTSTELFNLRILPPVIKSFSPEYGSIGTQVTIVGENFDVLDTGNIVKFGNTKALINSVTETQLVVTVPTFSKTEKLPLTVESYGIKVASTDSFDVWFPWKKLGAYNIDLYGATSFTLANRGFFIQRNSVNLMEYHPSDNSFNVHSQLPENSTPYGYSTSFPLACSSATKAIVLLNSNVYSVDSESFKWTLIAKCPSVRAEDDYMFYLNNEIYIGNIKDGTLNKYNESEKIWTKVNPMPSVDPYYYSYYAKNNEGYIFRGSFRGSTSISRYKSNMDLWENLTFFPFETQGWSCQFFIEQMIYTGFGYTDDWSDGYCSNQIWQYNVQNNQWLRYRDCPKRMKVGISLTLNDKGYAFSSEGQYSEILKEVWEFDPSKN